ncbi:hypothetical protein [Mycobacterium marseillense]|uniref:UsfY protein n=1 Tax=Mycobacterium marseillense TaxID=701042 RepID=A0ABM7JAW9_9MYCO|nr:hypothetical protein [Mycobacterium marseillense]MCA2265185.1 hypothetical protein [Mycobacterium marseillense]MCV7405596.1 hypothetical protein [Mycobacterium marseillense]OBJ75026.1 hypothetical protein A5626_01715 [Mycobacterium marseillense]ORA94174.1 hypothetical protein BST31_08120 [Mycobacterium marseillense]BBY11018.1 hypothetical protein MMARJ_17580 [Mycobacterium marseillense]
MSGLFKRPLRWVYSTQGTIILSVVPLLIGIAALYGFFRWGGAIFLITGLGLLALTIYELVRLHRRGPRRPAWVPSDEPQPGSVDKPS